MDINVILQVAIGVIFVWIILAVVTSQVQDWISSLLSWRANMLEDAVKNMLGDPVLKDKVYNHPLIKGLWTNNGKRKPGGIPEDKFALVLFEAVINADQTTAQVEDTFQRLKQNVATLKTTGNHELQNFATTLDTLLIGVEQKAGDATHAINEARTRVESWFNNSMERLGGSYRRRTQIVGVIVGIAVAISINADTAAIASTLWRNPVLREALVTQASQLQASDVTPGQEAPSVEQIMQTADQLNVLSMPIGWSAKNIPSDAGGWVSKIFGLIVSGLAGAQGAPYWFDLMRKLLSRGK